MASGSKEQSVFTGNSTGGKIGVDNGQVKHKVPGGTLVSPYPQDNVHGVALPDTMGGDFGGSCYNLSHSLKGTGAVQDQQGASRSGGSGKKEI